MDFEDVCIQYLESKQFFFEEQLEDLNKSFNEYKKQFLEFACYNHSLDKEIYYNKDILKDTKQQEIKEIILLKEQKESKEKISDIIKNIKSIQESLQKLKDEATVDKEELKQVKKPLVKAIKKYLTNFKINIEVKNCEKENTFIASVNFSGKDDAKLVYFIIDRKDREIIAFDASAVLSDDDTTQAKVKTESVNIEVLLSKLRIELI